MIDDQNKSLPRLFVDSPLFAGGHVDLPETQAHYLRHVLRRGAGDGVRVFNGRDGAWRGALVLSGKKSAAVRVEALLQPQRAAPDVWVLAAPVKKDAFAFMLEKASELGAARFVPVLCARSVVDKVNADRARACATEAAEQCERLDVMVVDTPRSLEKVLQDWNPARKIVFCAERSDAPPVLAALQGLDFPLAVLVGPEGGFTPREMEMLSGLSYAVPVSLGPRILRAETAVCAALSAVVLAMQARGVS